MKPEIFKVRFPAGANPKKLLALAFNRKRTIERSFRIDDFILGRMDGLTEKFFWGRIDLQTRHLVFLGDAPWQAW